MCRLLLATSPSLDEASGDLEDEDEWKLLILMHSNLFSFIFVTYVLYLGKLSQFHESEHITNYSFIHIFIVFYVLKYNGIG